MANTAERTGAALAVGLIVGAGGASATTARAPEATTTTVAATTTTVAGAPVGDCAQPYDRAKYFGTVPTKSARDASIKAATNEQGEVIDFYTGLPLDPTRIDIDHILPLAVTWPTTCSWTRAQRRSLAVDQLNLRPTELSINRSKSDQTPSEWSPADRTYACRYVLLYLRVAAKWGLPVAETDIGAAESACLEPVG